MIAFLVCAGIVAVFVAPGLIARSHGWGEQPYELEPAADVWSTLPAGELRDSDILMAWQADADGGRW